MYIPEPFRIMDETEAEAFMIRFDFATVVSSTSHGLISTHAPVVVRRERGNFRIAGHVARDNPHWKEMSDSDESLIIFHGPHSYISPAWYVHGPAVPTWNYAVVHAYGALQSREDSGFLGEVLSELVRRYEDQRPKPWRLADLPGDFYELMVSRIVGFEMEVRRWEGKFKLSQNRPAGDQDGVIRGLENESSPEASALAEFMRIHLKDG